jgi:hypothetical protein
MLRTHCQIGESIASQQGKSGAEDRQKRKDEIDMHMMEWTYELATLAGIEPLLTAAMTALLEDTVSHVKHQYSSTL